MAKGTNETADLLKRKVRQTATRKRKKRNARRGRRR